MMDNLNEDMIERSVRCEDLDNRPKHISSHQPHVFTTKTSREFTSARSLSDALTGLDMSAAVKDPRRFNYVCKLLEVLITEKLRSLSGTAQRHLMNLLEEALNTVVKSQINTQTVRDLLDRLSVGLDESEYFHVGCTTLWKKHITTVRSLQNRLNSMPITERKQDGQPLFEDLPDDCLRLILFRFSDSQDIVNTGLTDESRISDLSHERLLWRQLCDHHFSNEQVAAVNKNNKIGNLEKMGTEDWKLLHHRLVKRYGKKDQYAEQLHICRNCNAIYWQHHGHPCLATDTDSKSAPVSPSMFLEVFTA